MAKVVCLLLGLVSLQSSAGSHSIGLEYLQVKQELFGTIKFDMPAAQLSYTYVYKDKVGVRASLGRSKKVDNSLFVDKLLYNNQIKSLYGVEVFYRVSYQNWRLDLGVGKTDYKTVWEVNGVEPHWSGDTDSDTTYNATLSYKVDDNISLSVGYSDLYRKHKEGYGKEETKYLKVGFSYSF